jgi:predicted HAD superfamily Cof-like phosphohydrolase
MSKNWLEDIKNLMNLFQQPVRTTPTVRVSEQEAHLRYVLVHEESNELLTAIKENNLEKIADGIVDTIVVTLGAACTYGIDVQPIWDEIHKTNLLKSTGPINPVTGKKQKPEGWKPPEVVRLLKEQGWDPNE